MAEKKNLFSRMFGRDQQPVITEKQVQQVHQKRSFDAARLDSTLADWVNAQITSLDEGIAQSLPTLRARSRDCVTNNPYGKRYVQVLEDQVIGPVGIQLKMAIRNADGSPDKFANIQIEDRWQRWSKDATTCGLTLRDALAVIVATVATDGEVFLIKRRGRQFGDYMFQLQIIEGDYVPHGYNETLRNGNRIKAGVEYNEYGRAVAYHVTKHHPKDRFRPHAQGGFDTIRFEASDVIHLYDRKRASQGRGYPWTAAALRPLAHLKDYINSELVASRVAAAKMGFYTRPAGEDGLGEPDPYDPTMLRREVSPGSFDVLPEGYTLETFNPNHPHTSFKEFTNSILFSVAASLGISHSSLTTNMSETNYSSARIGSLDERETFKSIQQWLIESLLTPVFEEWLQQTLTFSVDGIRLPMDGYRKFNAPDWRPRHWTWVDPAKEAIAIKTQLAENLRSRTDVARQMGYDYATVLEEIAAENELARELGITIEPTEESSKKEILTGEPPKPADSDEEG